MDIFKLKIIGILFSLMFFSSQVQAGEIKLLNIDVLGNYIAGNMQFLPNGEKDDIYPVYVGSSFHKGRISTVLLIYPSEIGFENLRNSINKLYKKYSQPDQGPKNNPFAIWHLPNKIEIQMQRNDKGGVDVVFLTGESFEW